MNAATVALSLALSALPYSKLGAQFHDSGTTAAAKVLSACPRVAVFVVPQVAAINAISSLTTQCPEAKVVVRFEVPGVKYTTAMDASQSALDFWNKILGNLAGLSPYTVSYVEGPNELENLPDWTGDANAAAWVADFYSAFADHVNTAGFHPLVGAIPAGAPKLAGELSATSANLFKPIATAMKAKSYPWGWSYHSFSAALSKDEATEAADALRYRRIRTECGLEGKPLVVTAAGQAAPGWLTAKTLPATYLDWMGWFDARLHEDADVVGAALYKLGGTTDTSFSLDSLADSLATLIEAPPPDAGTAASTDAGTSALSDASAPASGDASAPRDASKGGGSGGPPGGGGTPVEPDEGCSTAGLGAAPALGSLVVYALWRRRRR